MQNRPTASHSMNLVLNEEIDKGYQCTEEAPCKELSVSDGSRIAWTKSKTSQRPGQGGNQIRDHKDIMPTMVVC